MLFRFEVNNPNETSHFMPITKIKYVEAESFTIASAMIEKRGFFVLVAKMLSEEDVVRGCLNKVEDGSN